MSKLKLGDRAPQFHLKDHSAEQFSLANLRGKKVILYFYPKDDTPGCTQQACDFRDAATQFMALNAVVIGISKDSLQSHQKFRQKFALPFILLSDESGEVCEEYGVIVDKNMYGKKYRGIERTTFLIDEMGMIKGLWNKVKVTNHIADVLEYLENFRITA
jgi:peroxiredoxin Q/BCP